MTLDVVVQLLLRKGKDRELNKTILSQLDTVNEVIGNCKRQCDRFFWKSKADVCRFGIRIEYPDRLK